MRFQARARVLAISAIATVLWLGAQGAWGAGPNPVLALSFDEGSGTLAGDSSGSGNNGTITGAVWTASGKFAGALDFNGVSATVTVPDSNSLDLTNGLTIEAWVYPAATPAGWQTIVSKEIPGDAVYTLYANTSANRPQIGLTIGGTPKIAVGTSQLPANAWSHLAATYNGAALILFVNGVQVASQAVTGNIAVSADQLSIGASQYLGEPFKGAIDNIRIYNQALSASEVTADMNAAISSSRLVVGQPLNNAVFAGSDVSIAYSVGGSVAGVDHAVFQIDGGAAVSDPTLDGVYQFTSVPFGPHTLAGYLAAVDNSKIPASDTPPVSFRNTDPSDPTPPTVSLTLPVDGAQVFGTVPLQATAFDNIAVEGVQFFLDNNPLGPEANSATSFFEANWNSVGTPDGSHVISARARDAAGNIAISNAATVAVGNGSNPGAVGQWGPLMDWPLVAVHSSLMPTGEFLLWDAWEVNSAAKVWNPTTGLFTPVPSQFGLFCAHQVLLPDGKVFVIGGHDPNATAIGIREANIFDPVTKTWSQASSMLSPRWYPTSLRLPNGKILALSGELYTDQWVDTPEIFDPATNSWSNLIGVDTFDMHDDQYPLSHLLPNGKIFSAGTSQIPAGQSLPVGQNVVRLLDVQNKTWTNLDSAPTDGGTVVMYRPGKILMSGGGSYGPAQTSIPATYAIDMNQATPAWRTLSPMAYGRYLHNLTILADGTVFAVGGSVTVDTEANNGVLSAEIWNPDTESWSTMATMQNWRNYHSTSVLMPDGRVLSAGGGRLGAAPTFLTAQIYSPPYLFRGSRPTIASAPAAADIGGTITVQTPDAASISKVALVPLSTITHTIDSAQTYLQLPFTAGPGQIQAVVPNNVNNVLPGYFMLFVLNSQGVPAIAPILRIRTLQEDAQPPSQVTNVNATGGAGTAALTWTPATDNVAVVLYNVYRSTSAGFTPSAANRVGQSADVSFNETNLAPNTYYYVVTAQDAAGNVGPTSVPASAVVTSSPDTQPPTAPTNLTAVPSGTSVTLLWTPATDNFGVVQYSVYRSRNAAFVPGASTLIGQSAAAGFLDTGVSPGTYYYKATAHDAAGNVGPASNQATALLPDVTPPTSPGNLLAVGGPGSAFLAWTIASDDVGVVKYNVYRSTTSPFSPAPANRVSQQSKLTLSDSGLAAGTYYYQVSAEDAAGNVGAPSNTASATVAVVVPSGRVMALPFDEGVGTAASDVSGYGNTGTLAGTAWNGAGKHGLALDFNGASSAVAVGDSNSLHLTNGMTLEAWVYPASAPTGWQTVMTKEIPGDGVYALYANSVVGGLNRPYVGLRINGTAQSLMGTAQLPASVWTYLAATYDGAALVLYVNGVQAGTKAVAGNIDPSTGGLSIGGGTINPVEYFNGRIDDVLVYNRALSAAEIASDMSSGLTSNPSGDTQPPTAPGTLRSLRAGAAVVGVSLTWGVASDNVGVAYYNVYRSSTSGFAPSAANRIAQTPALVYNDSGIPPGKYFYLVTAQDAAGNVGPPSNEIAATVNAETTPPSAPGSLSAAGGQGSAALSWGAATDNIGVVLYNVYRSSVSGVAPSAANRIAQPTGLSYNDTGVAPGTYYYVTTAQDAAGNVGPPSNEASAVVTPVPDTQAPTAPSNLAAVASGTAIALTWAAATDNVGVAQYNVHRGSSSGFAPSATNRIAQPSGTGYVDSGLATGSYYYKVTAQDAAGNVSTASNQASALVDITPPSTPANLQAAAFSSTVVNLTWSASTDVGGGVAGYRVYRGAAANSLAQIGPALVASASYQDTGVTANGTYYYTVEAVDTVGNLSVQATPVSVTTPNSFTVGTTTVGTISDTGYGNTLSAFRYQTGAGQSGAVSSITVYIPAPIGASPNNLFQVAIYSDSGGNPGTLIASSASRTITAAGWNTAPIAATLSAGTAYWFVYNTNASTLANNSLILSNGGTMAWKSQTFGTWPTTFGTKSGSSTFAASIYATVN